MYNQAEQDETYGDHRIMFFNHCARSYHAFMTDDEEMLNALDQELANNYGADC